MSKKKTIIGKLLWYKKKRVKYFGVCCFWKRPHHTTLCEYYPILFQFLLTSRYGPQPVWIYKIYIID